VHNQTNSIYGLNINAYIVCINLLCNITYVYYVLCSDYVMYYDYDTLHNR